MGQFAFPVLVVSPRDVGLTDKEAGDLSAGLAGKKNNGTKYGQKVRDGAESYVKKLAALPGYEHVADNTQFYIDLIADRVLTDSFYQGQLIQLGEEIRQQRGLREKVTAIKSSIIFTWSLEGTPKALRDRVVAAGLWMKPETVRISLSPEEFRRHLILGLFHELSHLKRPKEGLQGIKAVVEDLKADDDGIVRYVAAAGYDKVVTLNVFGPSISALHSAVNTFRQLRSLGMKGPVQERGEDKEAYIDRLAQYVDSAQLDPHLFGVALAYSFIGEFPFSSASFGRDPVQHIQNVHTEYRWIALGIVRMADKKGIAPSRGWDLLPMSLVFREAFDTFFEEHAMPAETDVAAEKYYVVACRLFAKPEFCGNLPPLDPDEIGFRDRWLNPADRMFAVYPAGPAF
ncbi:MAG: hypothetical protein M3O22_05960 [Pseudomonadota bacterium]|nr:hypothetical protein [Pseudomonadota bacterium]